MASEPYPDAKCEACERGEKAGMTAWEKYLPEIVAIGRDVAAAGTGVGDMGMSGYVRTPPPGVARQWLRERLTPDPNHPELDTHHLHFPRAVEEVEGRIFWLEHLPELLAAYSAEKDREWMAAFSRAYGTDKDSTWTPADVEQIVRDLKRGVAQLAEKDRVIANAEKVLTESGRDYGDIAGEIRKLLDELGTWQDKHLAQEGVIAELRQQRNAALLAHDRACITPDAPCAALTESERRVEELGQALGLLTIPEKLAKEWDEAVDKSADSGALKELRRVGEKVASWYFKAKDGAAALLGKEGGDGSK